MCKNEGNAQRTSDRCCRSGYARLPELNSFHKRLEAFAAETAGELDVLRHDGYPATVDSAQTGVREQVDHVGLRCLLHGEDGAGLETQTIFAAESNLTDQTLEGKLAEEKFSALLVLFDVTEGNGPRAKAVGLLGATGAAGRFLRLGRACLLALGGETGAWYLPRRLTRRFLGASHE